MISALKHQEKKGVLSLIIYLITLASALYIPAISLVCFLVVSLLWIIPDQNIEKALREE